MKNVELNAIEKELSNFDFKALSEQVESAKAKIAAAQTAADVKAQICSIWSKVRKYITALEIIPVIGKFITIFAELLDALCAQA